MPLLGKKAISQIRPVTDIKPDETIYTIAHTQEQFRSREDFEKRLHMYNERVWTCQCTGHTNLSHEEALNSEKAVHKTLKAQFSPCYEKSVLELVHHSTLSLETLVDQSWLKLQQCLCLNEKASLKIKTTEKCLEGTVVKIDINGVQANPTNNCSSPSSDKENSSEASGDSSKKWVPPKLLPYKYSLKLDDADKVIHDIPAADLTRCDRPPSKELLRLFIRANAIRSGPTQPWVVDDNLVKKYKLPSKFVDFLLSPAKMAENVKLAEEKASAKKRKSVSASADKQNKKAKGLGKKSTLSDKKQKKLNSPSLVKRTSGGGKLPKSLSSPAKRKSNEIIEVYSESSDDEALINLMPLSVLKEGSPKKGIIGGTTPSSSTTSTPRKRGRPRKEKNETTPKKRQSVSSKKEDASPKKRRKTPTKKEEDSSANKRVSPRKRKKTDKNMKQMTLFDLKSQKTPTKNTPDKKKVATPPRTPWVVTRILKAKKDGNKVNFNLLTTKAAKDLTAAQRSRLPEEIKEIVLAKYDKLEEKRKMKKMTPAEKEAYLLKKKEERKKKLADRIKARNVQLRKRYEDQDLELKPIPDPKLVPTPDGLPNELFGEVAMVTEFISCYSGLLMPDEEYPIQSDALVKALASGPEGFAYLSRVLKVLLQTLLQDGIAEYYAELDTPLSDIAVTPFTASELVRLCLRKQDDEAADNDVDNDVDSVEEESEVPEDIIQVLETTELFQLTADQKLKILKGLCQRIMGSYSVQDYMEEKQKEASVLWRQKTAQLKEKNKTKKRGDKKKEVEEKPEEKPEETKATDTELGIAHFYGKKTGGTAESTPEPESNDIADSILAADPADIDLAGVVKRRRVLAARAAAEKAVKEKEDKIRREKEAVEYRKQKEMESFEKSFNEGIALAKLVLRQSPIGTDRNHNRYWVFTNTTPGLFVEKGWVTADITYNYKQGEKSDDENSIISSDDDDEEDNTGKSGSEKIIETTFPHYGQNLWFMYDTVKDFETLIENLHPNGVRENALKNELKKRQADIVRAINSAKRTNNELRESDGNEEMLAGFKKELLDLELRLRNGQLGGVPDLATWEAKLMDSTKIEDLGACLNETQLFTMDKFLKGIFVKKEKKGVKDLGRSDPSDGDVTVKTDEEEKENVDRPQTAVDKWREGLEQSQTLSRLHVLMGIFDSCIKWEKSAENAKCKICRKKGEDNQSLLCDDCNQAFHLYCLRPALPFIPDGEWFCPACRPQTQRRRPVPGTYRDMNGESSEGSEDEELSGSDEEYKEVIQHDENCLVCGGDEGLAFCSECPSAFHLDCHVPPLRHTPRSNWVCSQCKTGVKIKSKRHHIPVPTKKRRKCYDVSSDEADEFETSDEDDDEDASDAEILPTSRRRGKATGTPAMRSVGTTTSDIEKVIIPTKYKTQQKRHESRRSEPTRRADNKKSESRRSEGSAAKAKAEEEEDMYTGYMRPTCKRGPSDLSLCEQILGCLFRHKSSWPFQSPVNKKEVPDYYTIIKKPMDFQTIKNNILCFVYSSPEQFVEDVSLVFRNAAQYNKIDSEVYTCMLDMEECFTELLRKFLPECRYERETTLNGYDHNADASKRPRRI
ncbi:tyrosine-protein kinase BAZ1B-like [Liolophura sinensis]|uniref:tyrosine-protein kinase BAZ1B-like n=1 Tax=Liolophura sinensis TaxID=3198878 RepID=UPI003158E336